MIIVKKEAFVTPVLASTEARAPRLMSPICAYAHRDTKERTAKPSTNVHLTLVKTWVHALNLRMITSATALKDSKEKLVKSKVNVLQCTV